MSNNIYNAPFYNPPSVSTPFNGNIEDGQIKLFADPNWSSTSFLIDIFAPDYIRDETFTFTGSTLNDRATWIVFKLPKGVVCTLTEHPFRNHNSGDFSGAGNCVDLIGNGEIQTIDLQAYGLNDSLSAGIWRSVEFDQGWFQLFEHPNQTGKFTTVFLTEWSMSESHSIREWWLENKASSINYPCLTPTQLLYLFDTYDGGGQTLALGASNPFGKHENMAMADLNERGMNDRISSFCYSVVQPEHAEVTSSSMTVVGNKSHSRTYGDSICGVNDSNGIVSLSATVAEGRTATMSHTTSQQFQTGLTITSEVSASISAEGVASVSSTLSTSLSMSYDSSSSRSTSNTVEIDLQKEISFEVPAKSEYTANWTVEVGNTESAKKEVVTGLFYYKDYLPGSVLQTDDLPVAVAHHKELYLLEVPITLEVSGEVGSQVRFDVVSTKLSDSTI